ncbi:hypothetical protein BC941DRAFT_472815 [Chlamydoabsidia padenii]|nr:hypothetical protein BC941DRAFT_472815 [Chlamydoabsidia padenii]
MQLRGLFLQVDHSFYDGIASFNWQLWKQKRDTYASVIDKHTIRVQPAQDNPMQLQAKHILIAPGILSTLGTKTTVLPRTRHILRPFDIIICDNLLTKMQSVGVDFCFDTKTKSPEEQTGS